MLAKTVGQLATPRYKIFGGIIQAKVAIRSNRPLEMKAVTPC